MIKKHVLLFAGIIIFGRAQCQEDTRGFINLRLQEVNATEVTNKHSGSNVTVIAGEDIRKGSYNNVAEVLQFTAGIYIVGTDQNPGTNQSIFMRGAGSEHLVVMIDGIRITDPSSVNNAVNLNELSMHNIERIEIIRGPSGVMYGTGSVGGVINIVTNQSKATGIHGNVLLTGGVLGKETLETRQQGVLNYRAKNGFFASTGLSHTWTNGLDATLDTITNPAVFRTQDLDGWQSVEGNLKIGWKSKKTYVAAWHRYASQQTDLDAGAYRDDDNAVLRFNRNLTGLQASHRFTEKFTGTFNAGFSAIKRDAENDSSVVDTNGNYDGSYNSAQYQGTILSADAMLGFIDKWGNIKGGVSYYGETMSQSSYYYINSPWGVFEGESSLDSLNISMNMMGAWLNGSLNGGSIHATLTKLVLEGGIRGTVHNLFGFLPVAQGAIKYSFPHDNGNSTLFTSAQQGFNAPALYRLYAPESNFVSGITRGNKNLRPELATNFELGYRYATKNLWFDVSIFRNKLVNSIQYVYLWDGSIGLDTLGNDWMRNDYRGDTYLNLGTMVNTGLEMSLTVVPIKSLTIRAQASLINGSLTLDDKELIDVSGFHIQHFESGAFINKPTTIIGLDRRSNTASLQLNYRFAKMFNLGFRTRLVSPRYDLFYDGNLGPYGALNRAAVQHYAVTDIWLGFETKGFHANLRAGNVFNASYVEINGYRTRPFGIYLNAGYRF